MKQSPRIAIDFGGTCTKAAFLDEERSSVRLIHLGRERRETIPSVFHLPVRGEGEITCGEDAIGQIDSDPSGVVRELKLEIEKSGRKRVGKARLTATRVELVAKLFAIIYERCDSSVLRNKSLRACTLTVPVLFTEQQRSKLVDAAFLAGFRDVEVVDEASAATAWACKLIVRPIQQIVICDIGGSATRFSAVSRKNEMFSPNENVLPREFLHGGCDIDNLAIELLGREQTEGTRRLLGENRESFLMKMQTAKKWCQSGMASGTIVLKGKSVEIPTRILAEASQFFIEEFQEELAGFLSECENAGIFDPTLVVIGGGSQLPGLKIGVERVAPGRVLSFPHSQFASVLGAVPMLALTQQNLSNADAPEVKIREERPRNHAVKAVPKSDSIATHNLLYEELFLTTIADGSITREQRLFLIEQRNELGISEKEADGIEAKFADSGYLEVLGDSPETMVATPSHEPIPTVKNSAEPAVESTQAISNSNSSAALMLASIVLSVLAVVVVAVVSVVAIGIRVSRNLNERNDYASPARQPSFLAAVSPSTVLSPPEPIQVEPPTIEYSATASPTTDVVTYETQRSSIPSQTNDIENSKQVPAKTKELTNDEIEKLLLDLWLDGSYADVIDRCNQFVALGYKHEGIYRARGWAYAKLGEWQWAVDDHEINMRGYTPKLARKDFASAYFECASVLFLRYREGSEIENFRTPRAVINRCIELASKAVDLNPTDQLASLLLTNLEEERGKLEAAESR